MKINGSERETLGVIASCPFADRLELAAMSGASRSAVYEAVGGLEDAGLVAHVPHAADLIPPTRRYHLTARGLDALAESEGLHPRRPAALPPRLHPVAAHPDGPARRPGRHIPPGLDRGRRRPPGRPPPVPGRTPRRRLDPSWRADRGDRKAGTRRRQNGLLTAALEAARRAAPRNGPRPGHRRGAVETRPQDAAPHRGGAARPGTGTRPSATRGRGVASRRLRPARQSAERPGGNWLPEESCPWRLTPRRRTRPATAPRTQTALCPSFSNPPRSAPSTLSMTGLAAPHRAGEPDGRLRAPRVPARQPPGRVRPRDPSHRRKRTTGPHRTGDRAPGPKGPAPPSLSRGNGGASPPWTTRPRWSGAT